MAKDWGLEWRLVPAKARESCRWQSVDGAWISLTLGHQKDITKILVTASDGRTEVVDGYEEGLNLARRWRAAWVRRAGADEAPARASTLSADPTQPTGRSPFRRTPSSPGAGSSGGRSATTPVRSSPGLRGLTPRRDSGAFHAVGSAPPTAPLQGWQPDAPTRQLPGRTPPSQPGVARTVAAPAEPPSPATLPPLPPLPPGVLGSASSGNAARPRRLTHPPRAPAFSRPRPPSAELSGQSVTALPPLVPERLPSGPYPLVELPEPDPEPQPVPPRRK